VILRLGALAVMGRLLSPNDYGLVAMVMAPLGVLNVFRDLGLSTVAIQHPDLSERQRSTLFWLNMGLGLGLTAIAVLCVPLLVRFYGDERLSLLAIVMSSWFLLYAAIDQHAAMLQREMRFVQIAVIETLSNLLGVSVGIVLAMSGARYWAIVGMTLATPAIYVVLVWLKAGWIPGLPRRGVGVISMVKSGGFLTAAAFAWYVAQNLDKVLVGRLFGADALGLYSRAYTLINLPSDVLYGAMRNVAMSTLAKVSGDAASLRAYFLRSYSILVSITIPITFACALFAEEIVLVVLGPKWSQAATIFRYLSPTALVLGLMSPTWPLLVALGLFKRNFALGLAIAPISIVGYGVGMSWGAEGAAIGLSAALVISVIPLLAWTVSATAVSLRDLLAQIYPPLLCSVLACLAAAVVRQWVLPTQCAPLLCLLVGLSTFGSVYAVVLLFGMGRWAEYSNVLQTFRGARMTDSQKAPANGRSDD
jgi:O-antigen/teichoic acid export membrane protein